MARQLKRILLTLVTIGAGLGLCAFGIGAWANAAIRRRARGAVYHAAEDIPQKPVAIVFGAKVWASGPSDILKDRLDAGIRLYRLGKVKKLLLSGDHGRRGYDEVNTMRQYVLQQGAKAEDVFLDHAGFRTYATLYRARDVFGVKSAVLVTNEFHLPRAIYTARAFGLDVVGLASDARTYRSWARNLAREFLARTLAWLQVNVTRPRPRHLGPRIDVTGDGRVTHDKP